MDIFNYDASEKRRLWNRKSEGGLERALEEVNPFFFPGAKHSPAFVVTTTAPVICHSGQKHCLPRRICLSKRKIQTTSNVEPSLDNLNHTFHFRSSNIYFCSCCSVCISACLNLVNTRTFAWGERAEIITADSFQGRRPEASLSGYERYEKSPLESPLPVEWTYNCQNLLLFVAKELQATYCQRPPAL